VKTAFVTGGAGFLGLNLVEQRRLPGVPPGRAWFCHAREVAAAQVAAFERGRSGHHYLLGGTDATFLELAQQIGERLGRSPSAAAART